MAARHGLYLYATDDLMPDHGSRCALGDCPFLMPAMVGVLARAFYDDPPMVWMIPDHQSRDRRLRRMFITILRHEAMRHGGVDVAWSGDRIVGAAVWMPPDTWKPPSAAQQLRSVPGFMRAFGRRISAASALMTPSLRRFRGSGL